ncbi:MAG: hypothetical protein U0Z44_11065 [Kouleothrix sp.]
MSVVDSMSIDELANMCAAGAWGSSTGSSLATCSSASSCSGAAAGQQHFREAFTRVPHLRAPGA